MTELAQQLKAVLGEDRVLLQEPMSRHTSFRVGGPADFFLLPSSEEELRAAFALLQQENMPYRVIGNGSNLLVRDEGFSGAVLCIGSLMGNISRNGSVLTAGAGASLAQISAAARDASLTGMEFASGIPGNLGGAVVMNAGAYDGEMKQVIQSVRLMTPEGEILEETGDELDLGYRHSNIAARGLTVLSAVISLTFGNREKIEEKMRDLNQRRREKQPLEYPSAGSTFRRPEGYYAGKLIQDAGMQGHAVGGAMISPKHAGFVINTGNATARDILQLIQEVADSVYEKSGVRLEKEIKILE